MPILELPINADALRRRFTKSTFAKYLKKKNEAFLFLTCRYYICTFSTRSASSLLLSLFQNSKLKLYDFSILNFGNIFCVVFKRGETFVHRLEMSSITAVRDPPHHPGVGPLIKISLTHTANAGY